MAIGRISGPLLAKNLLRDGVDLAFETDLLYLDVVSGRIGIRTSTPSYELDVNGTTNSKNLRVAYSGPGTGTAQLGKLFLSSGTITTTVGPITIEPSGGDDINLVNTVSVTGDVLPSKDKTYSLGSPELYWKNLFVDKIYANQEGAIDLTSDVVIEGNLRVKGANPIGTAPVVTNILYVTVDGSDTNDGRAQDASRACRTITGALRSPYYQPGTQIKVAPGQYYEDNPLELLPYTSIVGYDLRTTSIEPINKTQDLFHVQSGCHLREMQFLNGRSGLLPGDYAAGFNRGAYAVAFPPQTGNDKIDLFYSPYVQNCTNQSGPWLNDGTLFVPNQTVQVPEAVGTGTWVANTTTIVVTVSTGTIQAGMSINPGKQDPGFFNARTLLLANKPFIQEQVVAFVDQTYPGFNYLKPKCFRDVGIIVENIAYDSAFGGNEKSVESGLAYYNGVSSVILGQETQTIAAINYINTLSQLIISNSVAPDLLSGTGTYVQVINTALTGGGIAASSLLDNISIITTIINSGTNFAPSVYKSSGPDFDFVSAEVLLQANRTFIQNDTTAWIENNYPDFIYNQDKCYRDVGLLVDAVSQDILLGGNAKTLEAALTYWKGGYNQIVGQETTTTQAISHARDIALKIIANQSVTPQAGFVFNTSTCYRDTGLIVDSLAFDLLYEGTSQSQFSGLQYWNQGSYTGQIPSEITATIAAITFLQGLVVTTATNAGSITQGTAVTNCFNNIIDILNTGTVGVTDLIVPNGVESVDTNTVAAYDAILAAKNYYQNSVVSYVNSTYPLLAYNTSTCFRDVGYIVDSVAFDLLHGGNRQSIMSGVYYYGYTTSTVISNERPETIAAYNYIRSIVGKIVEGTTITPYQTITPQVTSLNVATQNEVNLLNSSVDLITNIIKKGPVAAADKKPINLTASTSTYVKNAFDLIQANRTFIQEEVLAYIKANYTNSVAQTINTYFSGGEAAAPAVERNFNIINTIITQGPYVAPPNYEGGGLFALTGLDSNEIKISSKVASVTALGSQVYQLTLDKPTVGFGTNATLYFGRTSVLPLQDADVPDQWQQRRIDPIGSMGGMLVDGGVISDRSPIASMVMDAYTQVNQGGRGIYITNNGYAQLVSVFTIFCSTAVQVDNGGICSITNSNSNFGDLCLVAKGYGKREFSGTLFNPAYPTFIPNGEYYPTGYYPKNGLIEVYVPDTANRPHISLVMEVEPPLDYINDQGYKGFLNAAPTMSTLTTGTIKITGINTDGIVIGNTLNIRDQYGNQGYVDTGTVVTDVGYQSIILNKPLISGGGDTANPNYFNLYFSGKAYYTVLSSTITSEHGTVGDRIIPNDQVTPEVDAITFITNTLTNYLSTAGVGSPTINFISDRFGLISSIASTATLALAEAVVPSPAKTGTIPTDAGVAIATINKNVETIVTDTINYTTSTYNLLTFNTAKCERDIRLILQQIIYDLQSGGNYNSVFSGLSYWVRSNTHHLVQLEENVNNSALFPDGCTVNFYQRSYMSASGYLFEYVGAGANYGALPQKGVADPVQGKEVIQLNNGRIFFTSTDQNGDFRIGKELVISQATGVLSGRTFTKSLFANLTPFILAIEGA